VDYPAAGQFIVDVERAAPEGATLVVTLDGKPALSQDFPRVPPDQHRTRRTEGQSQSFVVEISAGVHTVTIENTGVDWLYASYRLPNYLAVPDLRALALANAHAALVWVQNRDHTWPNLRKGPVTPAHAGEVAVSGLVPGAYLVEQWDTAAGRVVATSKYESAQGTVIITTPANLVGDVAYKVKAVPR
jgi:hypothetical protein